MKKAVGFESTSFHGVTIDATPASLKKLAKKLDAPYYEGNNGSDKSNFDFDFETDDGRYFTVYDWKEYRRLPMNRYCEFHIGGKDKLTCMDAKQELLIALTELN